MRKKVFYKYCEFLIDYQQKFKKSEFFFCNFACCKSSYRFAEGKEESPGNTEQPAS